MPHHDDIQISFPGGRQVAAQLGRHTILTDQPVDVGGQDAAPSPFALFMASIAACAGFYALSFFQKRDLPTEELRISARPERVDGVLSAVRIRVDLPADFPEKYREPLLRSIDQCSVKKAIAAPIAITIDCPVASDTEASV